MENNIPIILCAAVTTLGYLFLTEEKRNSQHQLQGGAVDLVELTDDTFLNALEEAKTNKRNLFIKLYAPWCGFCKDVAQTWIDLHQTVKTNPVLSNKVKIVEINADRDTKAREYFNLKTFPLFIFYNGKKDMIYRYDGNEKRTVDKFLNFIRKSL